MIRTILSKALSLFIIVCLLIPLKLNLDVILKAHGMDWRKGKYAKTKENLTSRIRLFSLSMEPDYKVILRFIYRGKFMRALSMMEESTAIVDAMDDFYKGSCSYSYNSYVNRTTQNHTSLGFLYFVTGNLTMAKKEFERAVQLDPTYVDAYPFLGVYPLAGSLFGVKRLLFLEPYGFELYRSYCSGWLFAPPPYYPLSRYHFYCQPTEKQRKELETALALSGEKHSVTLKQVIRMVEKKVEGRKENNKLHYALGMLALFRGDMYGAAEHAGKYIAAYPDSPEGYTLLGNVLLAQGKTEESIEVYKTSLSLNLLQEVVYFNLGLSYEKKGDFAVAERMYKKALETAPKMTLAKVRLKEIASHLNSVQSL